MRNSLRVILCVSKLITLPYQIVNHTAYCFVISDGFTHESIYTCTQAGYRNRLRFIILSSFYSYDIYQETPCIYLTFDPKKNKKKIKRRLKLQRVPGLDMEASQVG